MTDFLCQIEIALLNMLNLLKIQDFSSFIFPNCQIPGFFRYFSNPVFRVNIYFHCNFVSILKDKSSQKHSEK